MLCKICNKKNDSIFTAKILNKYNIKYYHCAKCGFLQTEDPHWIKESYSESINQSDTGYMSRNIMLSKKLTILLPFLMQKNDKALDYAGGYGVLVRLMRDIGFDFYWSDKFTSNLISRGFEYNNESIEVITTFEAFEHFIDPIKEISKMLDISKTIVFSTVLLPKVIPKPEEWWYYALDHGQHVSFYSNKTFKYIAYEFKLNYYNLGSLHLLTRKKIPTYLKILIGFSRFGLHTLVEKRLTSKVWSDYILLSKNKKIL
jgi:hypothetical protein